MISFRFHAAKLQPHYAVYLRTKKFFQKNCVFSIYYIPVLPGKPKIKIKRTVPFI